MLGSNSTGGIENQASGASRLVPAKCTSCGATLKVDAVQNAAICPYCNSAYIVEKAINNYNVSMNGNMNIGNATINISGANTNNLLMRAKNFEAEGDYLSALDYFNRVLDIDATQLEASKSVARVKDIVANYVYMETTANSLFSFGKLQLKKGYLVYRTNSGKETVYNLNRIHKLRKTFGNLGFMYDGRITEVTYACKHIDEWINTISKAQMGHYNEMRKPRHMMSR